MTQGRKLHLSKKKVMLITITYPNSEVTIVSHRSIHHTPHPSISIRRDQVQEKSFSLKKLISITKIKNDHSQRPPKNLSIVQIQKKNFNTVYGTKNILFGRHIELI